MFARWLWRLMFYKSSSRWEVGGKSGGDGKGCEPSLTFVEAATGPTVPSSVRRPSRRVKRSAIEKHPRDGSYGDLLLGFQ